MAFTLDNAIALPLTDKSNRQNYIKMNLIVLLRNNPSASIQCCQYLGFYPSGDLCF